MAGDDRESSVQLHLPAVLHHRGELHPRHGLTAGLTDVWLGAAHLDNCHPGLLLLLFLPLSFSLLDLDALEKLVPVTFLQRFINPLHVILILYVCYYPSGSKTCGVLKGAELVDQSPVEQRGELLYNVSDLLEDDVVLLRLDTAHHITDVVQSCPGLLEAGPAHGRHELEDGDSRLGETLGGLFEVDDVVHQAGGADGRDVLEDLQGGEAAALLGQTVAQLGDGRLQQTRGVFRYQAEQVE